MENENKLQKNQSKNETTLTDKNWAMLKAIEQGKSIKDAYSIAGYTGIGLNTPYEFYNKLKKRLELVYDADNIDSLRLKIRAKRILDLPIEDKPVKPETHLKAIETLARLTDERKTDARVISPFIILKSPDGKFEAVKGKVIDVTPIDPSKKD